MKAINTYQVYSYPKTNYEYEYSITISKNILQAMLWCEYNYGKYPSKRWSKSGIYTFVFSEQKDATWFSLKWQ